MADKELNMEPFDLFEEALKKEEDADSEERVWKVYIHIVPKELVEEDHDMYYVGVTSQTAKNRWENGAGYNGQYFGEKIQDINWQDIYHEIIAEHLTTKEASDMEKALIKALQSNDEKYGYNKTKGGRISDPDGKPDLTGNVYGRLTVIDNDPYDSEKVICQCSCENKTIKSINRYALINGRTQSCGCLSHEVLVQRSTTHNMTGTKLYEIWQKMKARCFNPTNKDYPNNGGKGISMFKDWVNDFESFYNWAIRTNYDEQNRNLIDRIDKTKDWEPSNCQWLTLKEKANRRSDNVFYTYKGKTQNLQDWANELGIQRLTLYGRLKSGMSIEEAFETPVAGEGSLADKRTSKYEYNGETHSIREWSEIYNINLKKMQNRIYRDKWDIAKVLDYYLKGSE